MTDLQCPTRLFVARHGEADYETTLVTDHGGSLSATGRVQARGLGERLQGERVARVWCSPLARAVQTAEIAAGVLGVDVVVREGLREYGVGALARTSADEAAELGPVFRRWVDGDDSATIPGGESVTAIVARVIKVLEEIRDVHRGEGVLVVGHGGTTMATLPVLLGAPRTMGYDLDLAGGAYLALEGDDSGWRPVGALTAR